MNIEINLYYLFMVHGGMWMRGDKQDDGSFMSSLYNVLMQATGL